MQSEQINELAAALAKAQADFGPVKKDKTMAVQGRKDYRYADLSSLLAATLPALNANGIAFLQLLEPHGDGLMLHTRLLHSSGQWAESLYPVAIYGRPQETGSALTYAKRYSAGSMLGVAGEDDDDGKAAQDAEPPKRRTEAPRPAEGLSDAQRQEIIKAATESGVLIARLGFIIKERWGAEAQGWSSLGHVPAEHFAEILRLVRAEGKPEPFAAREPGEDDAQVVGADGHEGEVPAEPCKHEEARPYVARLKPGKKAFCPKCTLEVTAADLPVLTSA